MPRPGERIVAMTLSKFGGPCTDCRRHIPKGGRTYKVSDPWGATTKHGQGPGRWVCVDCQASYDAPD